VYISKPKICWKKLGIYSRKVEWNLCSGLEVAKLNITANKGILVSSSSVVDGLLVQLVMGFQHNTPHMKIKQIKIWRVWWPYMLRNRVIAVACN